MRAINNMTLLPDERTFLGGLWADIWRIIQAIVGVAICGLFVGLLFAPIFRTWICNDLYKVAAGNSGDWKNPPTIQDMRDAQRAIAVIRVGLWIVAVLAWIGLFAANYVYRT